WAEAVSAAAEWRSPSAVLPAGFPPSRRCTDLTGFAAGGLRIAARRAILAVLGEDINLVPFLDHFVSAQLELAVRHAFAGLHVVFVAVPGAHEMHLGVGEVEALRGLVGHEPLLDLGDGEAFARGTALMQAEIAVGVKLALVPEYADLIVPGKDDAAVAVLELSGLPDVLLGHAAAPPWMIRRVNFLEFLGRPAPRWRRNQRPSKFYNTIVLIQTAARVAAAFPKRHA